MGRRFSFYGNNRVLCDVLQEMRTCHKTHNYAMLTSLIEEVQIMGNRMESALSDVHDLDALHGEIKSAKKEINKLTEEKEKLEDEKD